MTRILLIGAGGFLGSIARYTLSGFVQAAMHDETFPYGTLVVNVLGCFTIGVLSHLAEAHGALTAESRSFLVVGILGGFTTFSAFGNETMNLVRAAEPWLASSNVAANVIFGIASVWLGRVTAFLIWG